MFESPMIRTIEGTECRAHAAENGDPCWTIGSGSPLAVKDAYYGICGRRIRQAAVKGIIGPKMKLHWKRSTAVDPK